MWWKANFAGSQDREGIGEKGEAAVVWGSVAEREGKIKRDLGKGAAGLWCPSKVCRAIQHCLLTSEE